MLKFKLKINFLAPSASLLVFVHSIMICDFVDDSQRIIVETGRMAAQLHPYPTLLNLKARKLMSLPKKTFRVLTIVG